MCGDEFDALKTAFNALVDDYNNLPTKLKAQGVQRVAFEFSETDLGSTDLEESQGLCDFAGRLVSQLKQAETHHKKRLTAARALICTEASKMFKLISDMATCLHKARKDATGNRADQAIAYQAAIKFDAYTLPRVLRLLYLTKNKCLMKDTPESEPAPVSGMFRETLTTQITSDRGALTLTDEGKKRIAKKFNDAVERKYPTAHNLMTVFVTPSHNRRQLNSRRALDHAEEGVQAVTTWDADFPTKTTASFQKISLGASYITSTPELTSEPTSGTIVVTQPMTPIDTNLPDGAVEETTTTTLEVAELVTSAATAKPAAAYVSEATDTGVMEAAAGAVALVCMTVWFF